MTTTWGTLENILKVESWAGVGKKLVTVKLSVNYKVESLKLPQNLKILREASVKLFKTKSLAKLNVWR